LQNISISCNTILEFKQKLWIFVKPIVKREVAFNDNKYEWSKTVDELTHEDLYKFILIRDNTGNRTIDIESVSLAHLKRWRNKDSLTLLIHIYSLSLANGTMYKSMKKTLIDLVSTVPNQVNDIITTPKSIISLSQIPITPIIPTQQMITVHYHLN
jgi:hypothetical protein